MILYKGNFVKNFQQKSAGIYSCTQNKVCFFTPLRVIASRRPSRIVVSGAITDRFRYSLLCGVSLRENAALWRFHLLTQRATLVSLITRSTPDAEPFTRAKRKGSTRCYLFFLVAGMGFETHDLRVMSPTSYQAALPRDIKFGAGDRSRTGTILSYHGILSPRRLPIPPHRHTLTTARGYPDRLLQYYTLNRWLCQPFFEKRKNIFSTRFRRPKKSPTVPSPWAISL